jgi:pyruvate dehydrogenase E1 component
MPQPAPSSDEVGEWIEAFDELLAAEGPQGAASLLAVVSKHATKAGVHLPVQLNTPYVNTIPASEEEPYPGDLALERRINAFVRWNAMAMVHCQNKKDPGIGGHISTYSSAVTLFEVGFNHFFRACYGDQPGDFVYLQGHAAPVCTHVPFWKVDSRKSTCGIFGTSCAGLPASPPIRTHG